MPPLFSRPNFTPSFAALLPLPYPGSTEGIGNTGLQSVRDSSSLSLPPHTFPLLQCGSFRGLQSFRINLLLCELSTEATASARRTCSSVGYPQAEVPSGNVHLLQPGGLHGLHCGYLLWHSYMGCSEIPAPPWSSPWA